MVFFGYKDIIVKPEENVFIFKTIFIIAWA